MCVHVWGARSLKFSSALVVPRGKYYIQQRKPHRVLELPQVSCILAQDSLCTLLEASHPLVVPIICNVGLTDNKGGEKKVKCINNY